MIALHHMNTHDQDDVPAWPSRSRTPKDTLTAAIHILMFVELNFGKLVKIVNFFFKKSSKSQKVPRTSRFLILSNLEIRNLKTILCAPSPPTSRMLRKTFSMLMMFALLAVGSMQGGREKCMINFLDGCKAHKVLVWYICMCARVCVCEIDSEKL